MPEYKPYFQADRELGETVEPAWAVRFGYGAGSASGNQM